MKWPVQSPNPNGAGNTLMKTSCALSAPVSRASSWKANHRAWWCITIFGRPVVPDVEFRNHNSSAENAREGSTRLSALPVDGRDVINAAARVAVTR